MDPATAYLAAGGLSALSQLGGGLLGANSAQAVNAQQIAMQRDANFGNMSFARESLDNSNAQANINRELQWKMATHAYRIATADMRAAGINPLLAYQQGGSQMGSGSVGPGAPAAGQSGVSGLQNPGEHLGKGVANAVSSAVDAAKTLQGVDLMKQQVKVAEQEEKLKQEQQRNVQVDTANKVEQTFKTNAEIDVVKAMVNQVKAGTAKAHAEAGEAGERIKNYQKVGGPAVPNTIERLLRYLFPAGTNDKVPSAGSGSFATEGPGVPPLPYIRVKPKEW